MIKDKYDESPTEEKREAEDYLKKEVLLEKDHGRKEEEKMREMEKEKEKERKAVERAIREARERAFAEARERAERIAAARASAAAHQKAMADAQERLEKACTEAIAKSAAEKASMEAKLKAERAAVERATAEARERALEKALSEKAKARNHAEKFSGPSRDAGIKSDVGHFLLTLSSCLCFNVVENYDLKRNFLQDQQYKGAGPSNSFKYSSTSCHDGM